MKVRLYMAILLIVVTMAAVITKTTNVWSAINHYQTFKEKKSIYVTQGVFTGGITKKGLSLLKIKRFFSKKYQLERLSFYFGNLQGQEKKETGYYHVSIEQNPSRIVIDLDQVVKTALDDSYLSKLFSVSNFVNKALISMDSNEPSTKLVLELKNILDVEVFEKNGTLIIDIKKTKAPM